MGVRRLLLLSLFAVLVSGCCCPWTVRRVITNVTEGGSGVLVTREYSMDSFTEVVVSGPFEAEISQGQDYSVAVTVDDNMERYLDVEMRGSVLHIGFDAPSLLRETTLRARVTMPDLRALEASGASRVSMEGFRPTSRFDMTVSGASMVKGELNADDLTLRISGASTVTLDGSAGDADIEVSGASRARLEELLLRDVEVEASGASSAALNLTGRLNADASGASSITYTGNPTLGRISESGASSVRQR
jgi:hypothetical protein